jgi:hypothetical protein
MRTPPPQVQATLQRKKEDLAQIMQERHKPHPDPQRIRTLRADIGLMHKEVREQIHQAKGHRYTVQTR